VRHQPLIEGNLKLPLTPHHNLCSNAALQRSFSGLRI
jgi:hypothetical protein